MAGAPRWTLALRGLAAEMLLGRMAIRWEWSAGD
jgi:hypothetical protein